MRTALSRAEMRKFDRRAIEEFGVPGVVLMENAGRGCAELLISRCGVRAGSRIVICCGKGNNGGDGFVIARHLENRGVLVEVLLACEPGDLRGDAAINLKIVEQSGIAITAAVSPEQWHGSFPKLQTADWIVDALLGTGFAGTPREPLATAIDVMNQSGRPVLAIDLPSGLDADTGLAEGSCVKATRTATLVCEKNGFRDPARVKAFTGEIEVVDIGAPRRLLTSFGLAEELR